MRGGGWREKKKNKWAGGKKRRVPRLHSR